MYMYKPIGHICFQTRSPTEIIRRYAMKKNEITSTQKMIRTAVPVIGALMLFLISAGYIAYRMISNYNYNERWKDYDECGRG